MFNRDIELSCDETVLNLLGRNKRSDYALALIDMEEQKSGFASFASGFGRNAIEERIRAIMKMKKASIITILAAVVVVACVDVYKRQNLNCVDGAKFARCRYIVQQFFRGNLWSCLLYTSTIWPPTEPASREVR